MMKAPITAVTHSAPDSDTAPPVVANESSAVTGASTASARVRVVLCQTSHPGNIGSAARALKTMGFSRLVLVRPRHLPEEQAVALASGAGDVLTSMVVVDSLAQALAGTVMAVALTARRRELAVAPLWARDAALELGACLQSGAEAEVALVFGNETFGLSNEELSLCSHWAMIPANPAYSSLNLAAAVQLLCYETRLALEAPAPLADVADAGKAATHDDIERLLAHVETVAIASGFLDPAVPKRFMTRMRRLAARARVEQEEVAILRGLLGAVEKMLK